MAQSISIESKSLRSINTIRLVVLLTQTAVLAGVYFYFDIEPVWPPLFITLALCCTLIVFTWLSDRKRLPPSNTEQFSHLMADIFLQTSLLFWSGGYTNPMISVYLVTVSLSAALLPVKRRWFLTTTSIVCYTLLQSWYHPLTPQSSHANMAAHSMEMMPSMINLHLAGMWVTYTVSACLITGLVARMADSIRAHRAQVAASRESQLRSERILSVATTAAGAAHELGTPLSTMSVLLSEMKHEQNLSHQLHEDISLLQEQVGLCRDRLGHIVSDSQNQEISAQNASDFVIEVLDEWQLLRPRVHTTFTGAELTSAKIYTDQSLKMAFMNLLNNAADVSPDSVELSIQEQNDQVIFYIKDWGQGLSHEILDHPGLSTVSTKIYGHGLGLQLSAATIEKFKGVVRLYDRPENHSGDSGTITEIQLPRCDHD